MKELPIGWSEATIEELSGIDGLMIDGDWIESKDQDPRGAVRLVQLQDIGDGTFIDKSSRFLTPESAERLRCTFLSPGDVLIARMPHPLGRACILPNLKQRAVTAVDVCIWRAGKDGANPRWLINTINSPAVREELYSKASGTTRLRVSGGNLKKTIVPVPPSGEQQRIAVKVESLFARTHHAREELNRVSTLVARYKQAILWAAFRGDLTRDWREESQIEGDEALIEELWRIPNAWHWKTVADVGRVGLGRQRSPVNHHGPHMRPYVRAANITWSGWDLSDVKQMNFDPSDFERFRLNTGDVLINEGSGSATEVGKPAIWAEEIKDCCFQNTLIRVQPQDCTSAYLYYYFLFSALTERFVASTQGVNIFHIGKDGLARFPIPVMSKREQKEIVRRIEKAFTLINRISVEQGRALDVLSRLDSEILTNAYRGDLVSQNPTEEAAIVLLERLRAGRNRRSRATSEPQQTPRAKLEGKSTRKGRKIMGKSRSDVERGHLRNTLDRIGGSAHAKELWKQSGMDIDEFYKQLRAEVEAGHVSEGAAKDELVVSNAA